MPQTARVPAPQPVHELDFDATLRRLGGVALVLFTSPFCGACKAATRALAGLTEAALAPAGATGPLHLLVVDAGESAGLTADLEVFHLPAIFVYQRGEFHGALHAPLREDALSRALAELLAAPPAEPP